jgi:hypothetical protein
MTKKRRNMKPKKQPKTPSRERYELANPTVSARISLATRDKLLSNLEVLGMSMSKALKVLAGELEIKAKPVEEATHEGFQRAKKLYMVSYPCSRCGKTIPISDPKTKAVVAKYMSEAGWHHSRCPE